MTQTADRASLILPDDPHQSWDAGSSAPGMPTEEPGGPWSTVPWRTIIGAVLVVGGVLVTALLIYLAAHVIVLTIIAGFFAVVLARPVGALEARLGGHRSAAIAIVMLGTAATIFGLLAMFILPVRTQLVAALTDLPGTVRQAGHDRGPIGHLVTRLHIEQLVRNNQTRLDDAAKSVQSSMPRLITTAVQVTLSTVTVVVMTTLMLSQSKALARTALRALPMRHRESVRSVARDAGRAVSGYMIGNLVISLCAGLAAFVVLTILGVANPLVLALWVAFADLIPLVGATLGAVVAVVAAFLVSPAAGFTALVFFILYQQFENSVLQIVVMTRTVQVNSLGVLLSVVVGVELFGVVGALLSVPAAGALSVVVKELWRHRPTNPGDLIIMSSDEGGGPPDHSSPSYVRRWLAKAMALLGRGQPPPLV